MTGPPGWYPDSEQSPGDLRYWDGQIWTDFRASLPPGVSATPRSRPGFTGWLGRHKVITSVVAVVVLLWASSLTNTDPSPDATAGAGSATHEPAGETAASTPARESESSAEPSPEQSTKTRPSKRTSSPGPPKASQPAPLPKPAEPANTTARTWFVARIVDGDTLELGNGEMVRLVGIDTPEVGECGYQAAADNLSRLVLRKQVRLTISDENRDRYGRLLRYVNVGSIDAGLRLIRNGLAIARYDSRDGYGFHPRQPVYVKVDRITKNVACPRPAPLVGAGGSGSACAPGYSPCLPVVDDLNCDDVNGPITVTGDDQYGLDADGDGTGCDS